MISVQIIKVFCSIFTVLIFFFAGTASAQIIVHNPAGQNEDGGYIDDLITARAGVKIPFPHSHTEVINSAKDDLDEFNKLFLERGWGDGLPLIPPTPERVAAMLRGYDLPAEIPIATLAPLDGVATVEKIAINAVMAGCLPEHMPILAAAVEAISHPDFDLRGLSTTTNPDAVLLIVSGPIVKRLGLNFGTNTFGRGSRGNAAISRALHLVIQNVGGSRPGLTDMSTLGQPGDFVMFMAENGDDSPWPPFHTERGLLPDRNVVTVAGVEGYNGILGIGYSHEEYLGLISGWLRGHDRPWRGEFILVVAQDTARMLAREGWTRGSMREKIREKAKIPFGLWREQYGNLGGTSARGIPDWVYGVKDDSFLVDKPFFDGLAIIVAGGTGEKSMILPTWAGGKMISQEIRIPAHLCQ